MNKKYLIKFNNKKNNSFGFTLVEILIASYIFIIVVLAGTAIFSSSIGAKMKATALWQTQREIRYATEMITKSIRDPNTKGFTISNGGKQITLCRTISDPCDTVFRIIYLGSGTGNDSGIGVIYFQDYDVANNVLKTPVNYTLSGVINVTGLNFDGYHPTSGSTIQPYVILNIRSQYGDSARLKDQGFFNMETTISLRNYDFKYQ